MYINRAKVREFQFQIDNLFGCSKKPFSCDVEIRHADQITVLPIEIEVGLHVNTLRIYIKLCFCSLMSEASSCSKDILLTSTVHILSYYHCISDCISDRSLVLHNYYEAARASIRARMRIIYAPS